MKPLDCNYTANGKAFRILKREGDYCIAEQTGTPYKEYEVFKVQKIKDRISFGKPDPAHEAVPNNSQWGLYGWSWPSKYKHLAEEKFDQLINKKSHLGSAKERMGSHNSPSVIPRYHPRG
jgi:hypothetical protein